LHFLAVDAVGSALYASCFLALGYFFTNQIQQISEAVASIGSSALCLVVGVIAVYVAFKFWKRKRLLDELRMTRITVADLRQMMKMGDNIVILDMRSNAEYTSNAGIKGAIHLSIDDIKNGRYKIPRDREVVVYCSCPNDVTAARVALLLRRSGFSNVRPLLGGIDAWKQWDVEASERKAS
jgi:rhodanese-related sulfurtransferase